MPLRTPLEELMQEALQVAEMEEPDAVASVAFIMFRWQ